MKTVYKSKLANFNSDLWSYHMPIDPEIADQFIDKKNRRVICTLFGTHSFPCAIMYSGNGGYFINLNKDVRKKFNLEIGDEVQFSLVKDTSKYGMPVPEEMKELLEIDDEARIYFDKLTPGKQRSLLHLIGKPKSSDIRLNKALAITEYLKENNGQLDYKMLHQYIKEFNKF